MKPEGADGAMLPNRFWSGAAPEAFPAFRPEFAPAGDRSRGLLKLLNLESFRDFILDRVL
jgi:hypothetical protein